MNFDTPSIACLWLGPLLPSPGTPLPGFGIPLPSPGSPAASAATSIRNKSYELFFLPPYLPNLDLIERLWKFTKNASYTDDTAISPRSSIKPSKIL